LFTALAVIAAFVLGVRVGFAVGHRNARARLQEGARPRPSD
jgi:hypothetical protein